MHRRPGAELLLPHAMAEHDNRRHPGAASLSLAKAAAERRPDAQHVEVIGGHRLAGDKHAALAGRENSAHVGVGRDAAKASALRANIEVVRIRRRELGKVLVQPGVDLDQPLGPVDLGLSRSSTAFTTLKSAVLSPIPSASDPIAAAAKAGRLTAAARRAGRL